MTNPRLNELKAFVQFLRDENVFDFNNELEHRLALQKCVYIAKKLGWNCPHYEYSLYVRGPYSPALSFDIDEIGTERSDFPLPRFDHKRFVEMLPEKNLGIWLEVAGTLLVVFHTDRMRSDQFKRVQEIRPSFPNSYIERVFDNLKAHGLIF